MKWNLNQIQNLATIDRLVSDHTLSAAEYEIVRRVIHFTGDQEYLSLIKFSQYALRKTAAAISTRTPIIVDSEIIQTAIFSHLEHTFINPIYVVDHREIESSLKRYPSAIIVVGESLTILKSLASLINQNLIKPAAIITTLSSYLPESIEVKNKLKNTDIPTITIDGNKGGAIVSIAITNGLIDLAWVAYKSQNS